MGLAVECTVEVHNETDEGWHSAYVGEAMRLYLRHPVGADRIIFTFDYLNQPSGPPNIPAANLIRRRGAAHAHLSTLVNDWYQNGDVSDALAVMRRIRDRFACASTYGGSMGGYGALLFSKALDAERAVALGPQFSVDPRKAPFEERWNEVASRLTFNNDAMAEALRGSCRRIVVFDPACKPDSLHVDLLRKHGSIDVCRLPFCGHFPLQILPGTVSAFVEELLFGDARTDVIVPLRRMARRKSSRYYNQLAAWFAARHNTSAAFKCLSRAYLVDPTSTAIIETAFQVMQDQPAYTRLLQHMLLRLIQHEQPSWKHYAGAEAQLHAAIVADAAAA